MWGVLRSELKRLENGFLSDDQSKRLIVQLAKFKELCSDFKNVAKDVPLLKDLDRYIDAVTTRNACIDRYNRLLRARIDLAAELVRLSEQKGAVSGRLALNARPGLPAMAAFVSGLYERAKAEVIADLYLAYRAYALWALAPNDGFAAILGRSPQGIDARQLRSAWQEIKKSLRKSVDQDDSRPKQFPEDDASFGRVVVLRRDVHRRIFDDLLYESADLEILPATQASSAPASDFEPTRAVISPFEAAPPDVMNHNLETVPRLYRQARPGSDYAFSLNLLKRFKDAVPGVPTKSGLMVGLGETDDEILQVMRDMRAHGIDMLTIGQYLAPSGHHLPVRRYVHPDTFRMFERGAAAMGFSHAAVGAMVRSSYHADQQAHAAGVGAPQAVSPAP